MICFNYFKQIQYRSVMEWVIVVFQFFFVHSAQPWAAPCTIQSRQQTLMWVSRDNCPLFASSLQAIQRYMMTRKVQSFKLQILQKIVNPIGPMVAQHDIFIALLNFVEYSYHLQILRYYSDYGLISFYFIFIFLSY